MRNFNVPKREEVSENNQQIFDQLQSKLGFVPNLYALMAHSKNGLGNYLTLQGGKTSLSNKEKEVINLAVSQVNGCAYCLAAHTAVGKLNGFTGEQILNLRRGTAPFDARFSALSALAKEVTETQGRPSAETIDSFYAAGYTDENLIDTILIVADKIVMNYLHNITQIPIDFPQVEVEPQVV
ncbi:carboxymuconolactone decarboxylase family protein [Robertkochia aurantiaca]|uniref:carboxymuconolactone decarboxylase family protein n=1 Tax=Robertkochia aurantiaca TaxID=2873700 RepID=UPI001CCC45C3|nr:carboxymuconolactone decarboxylase family protein [Robertkochia sp. 3YJGBD-33]